MQFAIRGITQQQNKTERARVKQCCKDKTIRELYDNIVSFRVTVGSCFPLAESLAFRASGTGNRATAARRAGNKGRKRSPRGALVTESGRSDKKALPLPKRN